MLLIEACDAEKSQMAWPTLRAIPSIIWNQEFRVTWSTVASLGAVIESLGVTGLRRSTLRFDIPLQGFVKLWQDQAKSSKVT
jgi:hypothetical protein